MSRRGFTLIELLVALVIGATVLLGVAGTITQLSRLQQRSAAVAQQTALLRHWVELYSALPYAQLLAEPTDQMGSVSWAGPGQLEVRRRITPLPSGVGRRVQVIVALPMLTAPDTISIDRTPPMSAAF